VEAVRNFTNRKTIPAQIIQADELVARRISAAENIQREDLSAVEMIKAIVEIVDAN
jgi:ParB-like chromosome segregation protein Spo0J